MYVCVYIYIYILRITMNMIRENIPPYKYVGSSGRQPATFLGPSYDMSRESNTPELRNICLKSYRAPEIMKVYSLIKEYALSYRVPESMKVYSLINEGVLGSLGDGVANERLPLPASEWYNVGIRLRNPWVFRVFYGLVLKPNPQPLHPKP